VTDCASDITGCAVAPALC